MPLDTLRGPEYLCEAHARDNQWRFPARTSENDHLYRAREARLAETRADLDRLRRDMKGVGR